MESRGCHTLTRKHSGCSSGGGSCRTLRAGTGPQEGRPSFLCQSLLTSEYHQTKRPCAARLVSALPGSQWEARSVTELHLSSAVVREAIPPRVMHDGPPGGSSWGLRWGQGRGRGTEPCSGLRTSLRMRKRGMNQAPREVTDQGWRCGHLLLNGALPSCHDPNGECAQYSKHLQRLPSGPPALSYPLAVCKACVSSWTNE